MSTPSPALEKSLKEREQLHRHYRAAKAAEHRRLCADPQHGEQLRKFAATLNHFGIDDADNMIAYVRRQAALWARAAHDDIRCAALELVAARIVRIRQQAGLVPFDDPLPGEDDDVFQICKRELTP